MLADESVTHPQSFARATLLQEAVVNILRKYTDAFYRVNREQWDSRHMVYNELDMADPNLQFNADSVRKHPTGRYTVSIQRSQTRLVGEIERLIKNVEKLYEKETAELPRLHFDRHLYQPLLIEQGDNIRISPPGLKPSEKQFVQDLKDYWSVERSGSLVDVEVFLLRNLSRGAGIGFFVEREFYPDFILWIKRDTCQHIVFLEPHGMLHAEAYVHDTKARLHEVLPDLAAEIARRSGRHNVTLDSYVISATRFDDLQRKYDDGNWDRQRFADAHILFMEQGSDYDYIKTIIASQLTRACT